MANIGWMVFQEYVSLAKCWLYPHPSNRKKQRCFMAQGQEGKEPEVKSKQKKSDEEKIMSNTDTMKEVYLLAQEHCGLKIGDWVKVLREPEKYEAGWESINIYDFSDMIGRTFQIDGIYNTGIAVKRDDGDYVAYFPYFVLEKVERPAHEFKPYDPVLVRNKDSDCWQLDIFLYLHRETILDDEYACARGNWHNCIPYKGNEHLAGTTDKPEGV